MMGTLLHNAKRLALFSIFLIISSYSYAATYTWAKNGAVGNWNTAANWSPVGVPSALDDVIFNGTGTANCSIDANFTVNTINITSAYTGVISNTNFNLTINVSYAQAGGTFNGGNGPITIKGSTSITGGTFNSTTGLLQINNGPFILTSPGVFNANSGTVYLVAGPYCTAFVIDGNIDFCNLTVSPTAGQTPSCGYEFQVVNVINVNCCFTTSGGSGVDYNGGRINLKGCVCTQHVQSTPNNMGSTVFALNGPGTQVLYGFTDQTTSTCTPAGSCVSNLNFGRGRIPNLRIEKLPTDTVKIEGVFNTVGNYTYVSGVIKTKSTGILSICGGTGSYTTVNGPPHHIDNMALTGGRITFNTTITSDSAVIWGGINPTVNSTVSPAVIATRDVVVASYNTTGGGNAILNVQGSGTQTVYCNSLLGEGILPEVILNGAGNIVITRTSYPSFCTPKSPLANCLSNSTIWTYNSGNISGDGIVCFNAINSTNVINNTHTLPNISYLAPSSSTSTIISPTGTLTARDTLFTNGNGRLLINGQTDVTGSVYAMNYGGGAGGTGTITIKGSANATFSSTYFTLPQPSGYNGFLPNITIDKAGGILTLEDTIAVARNWSLLNGTVVGAPGSNVFLHTTLFNLDNESSLGIMNFYDLTIVGVVTKTLTGGVGVSNRFVLGDAKVTLGNYKFIMNSSNPANLVRTTGYVISENVPASGYGRFEWAIGNAAAASTFTYPFAGTGGTYIPFLFEVQTPGSAGGKLSLATYPTAYAATPNNLPFPTGVTNINNILGANNYGREVDRYWIPEVTGYTTNPSGKMTFTYRDVDFNLAQNVIVESRLEAHRWLPGTSAWQLPNNTSTRNVVANTVTIPNQNVFTPFTVVDPELPDLIISSSDTTICLGTAVNFFDGNTPTPNSSQWFFPGGTPATSTATNPTNILYTTTGCKTVILEGTYSGGVLRDTFPCFINVVNAASIAVNDIDITCNGLTNGKVWITTSGGTPPFTYTWSAGTGTQTNTPDSVRTGLAAGPYSITVEDAAGCGTTVTGAITAPPALTNTIAGVDPLCNNGTNGSVTITVSGGTPFATGSPYTYIWSPNVSTANTQGGLGAGTYNITATDANGCTTTNNKILTNPASLGLTLAKTDALCNGQASGKVWATVTGGTGAGTYTYTWSPIGTPGVTPDTTRNQAAGSVSVTVRDGNSCSVTGSIAVNQPAAIVVAKSQTNVTCFGGTNGVATVTVSGGPTGAPSYAWKKNGTAFGGNTNSLTGIGFGVYTVIVTQGTGLCTAFDTITITQPTQIVASHTSVNVGCNGASTGRITVSYTGGPTGGPATTYVWKKNNGPFAPTTATITGLTAGIYTVVLNVNGTCPAYDTITITQSPLLTSTTTQQNITCFNGSNGSATVIPAGGTGNYTYVWTKLPATPVVPGNTATISNLAAGDYRVVVTDDSSCTVSNTVTLANPAALNLVLARTNALCFGTATGKAWATVTGGTGPGTYTYTWSRGTNTPPNDDTTRALLPGFVSVTVTDGNGCSYADSINIGQSSAIVATATKTDATCFGGATGSANVTYTGGPASPISITYTWLRGGATFAGNNTATINNLIAGTYTVTVNIDGCQAFDTVTVGQPAQVVVSHTNRNVACFGGNTGSVTVTHTGGPTGGPAPTYSWQKDFVPFAPTTATVSSLTFGTYTVVVNVNGCFGYDTIIIAQPTTPLSSTITGTDPNCNNGTVGSTVTVTASGGTPIATGTPYNYSWTLDGTNLNVNAATVSSFGAGQYIVTITDDSLCTINDTFTLNNPAPIVLTMGTDSVSCFGICDGRAWVAASGGTTPYTYLWSNNGTTDTITGLCAGWYFVTVTDANGCTNNDSIEVLTPAQVTTSIAPTNVSCFGGNDGEATVTVGGGPTGFIPTYAWLGSNGNPVAGGNAATISSLVADTYTVTVDVGGCLAYDTIDITQPTQIIVSHTSTNVACFGGSTGSVTVSYTGGPTPTGGFPTYTWQKDYNPFAPTTATITGLTIGTYTVIVEVNGCFGYDTIDIVEPTQLTNVTTQQDISCFNGTDGSATATPSGGTPPYSYNWTLQPAGTFVGNTATISTLSAGVYQVEITDDSSCTLLDTVTLINPPALGLQVGGTNASCFGICDGEATVFVNGGTTPYTYLWSNGTTTVTITGLCAGWYYVTVTDAGGCANNDSVQITQPAQIVTSIAATNVSCFGGNNGTATVTHTGGPTPPTLTTYTWLLDGATFANNDVANITNLVAGTYTVIVDIDGCEAFDTIIVTQPTEIFVTLTGTDVTCFGTADGTATAAYTGGPTGTAIYTWQQDFLPYAPTTAAITSLTAATYSVIVEIGGCFGYDTIDIIEPTQLTSTITGTDPDCNGGTAGSTVTVTANGGTPIGAGNTYNYAWTLDGNSIAPTTPTVSNFGAGQYIVTITDANNCTINDTIVLSNPPAIVITKDSLNVKCFGDANGKAWVTVSGGTPGTITPYTIAWSGGVVVAPGDTIDNLLAGTYTVTVTDGRGCVKIDTFLITQPIALGVTLATDSISCFGGSDGRAWATATGGVGGYVYQWSPPGNPTNLTGDTIAGLSNLTYSITVTDDSTCTTVNSVTVPQPSQLILTHDSLNVKCFGENTGKAWVTASGGSPGYIYNWSGGIPTNATGDTIGTLIAGTYYVTVTDRNLCEAFDTVVITQPATALTLVMDSNSVSCFGLSDGKAWVTATGGTPIFSSYSYAWSSGIPIGLQDTIINLATGNYTVTVTDSNSCVAIDSVFITQPPVLQLTKDSINVLCFGDSTGKAWVTIAGGTPNYNSVVWTGGGTPSGTLNDTLNNLHAGTFTATVTDANGCSATTTFTITQPTQLVLNMFTEDVNCFGDSTGKAWVVVTGGTPGIPPYTYNWSGGTQAGAGDTIKILVAGTYTLTVTDGNGCTDTSSVNILQPLAPLSVAMDSLNIACFGQTTGKAWATVAGGTAPYNYAWSGGTVSGIAGDTIIGLAAGVYSVTITDNLGCIIEDSVNIVEPPLLVATTDSSDITCFGDSTGRAWVNVVGGTLPYTFGWSGGNAVSNGDTIIDLGAGIYIITVTDASGCIAIDTATVNEPAELVLTMDSINVTCSGANDGRAWVTANGGTVPYVYVWSSGTPTNATGDTIAGLSPGTYVVTVTDLYNCTKIAAVTIEEPNLLLGNLQQVNVRCFGENSGRAWIRGTGGTLPYVYTWSGGTATNAVGDTVTDLLSGTYYASITDANGCLFVDSVLITEPAKLLTVMDSIDVLCFGDSTGRAWVTATGGIIGAGYDYTWSGGIPIGDGDTVRTLRAGTYYVTVTDDTGCIALDTFSINQPLTPVTLVKDSVNILCFGDSTGSASVIASGGTLGAGSSYTYTWSRGTPNGTGDMVTGLSFGIVRVTVTDDNGCFAVASFNITQPNKLQTVMAKQNVLCFGQNTGKAWVTVTGGNPAYQYSWSAGTPTGTGDTITNLVAGTYYVDALDANGCTISDSVIITEPLAPLATTMDTMDVRCFGTSTGRAWVVVTGGTSTPPYTYSWSAGVPFGAGDTTLNLPAGPVSVTVTDGNGCTITDNIIVSQPATALSIVTDSSDVTCFSACDGQAWVTATGGTLGYSYVWANSTNTTDTLSSLCPGNYVVTVTDSKGCRAIDLVSVNEPDELLLTTVVDSSAYCNGNGRGQITVSLTGGTGPYDYAWSNTTPTLASPATSNTNNTSVSAGIYTVTVTDANGCSKIDTVEVFERAGPQVVNIDITATLCNEPNGAIILAVNTTDPALNYVWSHDAANHTAIAGGLESATYTVTITDAATCDTVIDIFVPAINKPVVDSVIVKDSYCGNDDGVASVQVSSGVPPYVFTWSHDATLLTNTATGLVEGSYSVTVTDANGCDTSLTVAIVEVRGPDLSVIPEVPQTIYSGQAVSIEVSLVSPIDSVYYEWLEFPGLDCYDCTNPIATPERTTTYLVRVTDNFTGCEDTAFVTIIVRDETNIFIPNAITPNGDGVNDTWMLRELATFPDNEVIILNRWGDVVFSASPYQNDFDGTFNGSPLPSGTYYYIIKLDNISESVTGPITIIK